MEILVLGGTGAIGAHLVSLLSNIGGHNLFVTTRRKMLNERNVTYLVGNAHDESFMSELLKRHYDAIVDFMSYKTSEFQHRYKKYLEATSQYVFLSSARVYADCGKSLITEKSPRLLDVCKDEAYLKTDEYALTKARQENLLLSSNKNNWTIIRPYITYSEKRLQLGVLEKEYWLYRALHGRTIVFSDDIADNTTTLTYGMDVSRGIAAILGKESAKGEAFHITGENSLTWRVVLNVYLEVLNKKGIDPKVTFTKKSSRLKYPEAKGQVVYDRYFCRKFDNSKISQYLDLNSFVNPKEGLKRCLETFIKNPVYTSLDWKEEALSDYYCREKAGKDEFLTKKDYLSYSIYRVFPFLIQGNVLKQKVKMFIKG